MKNGKGFTLVELLAVIVILALLVLVATPAVTSIMQKSQKNAFKSEVLSLVNVMETAYTEKSAAGATAFKKDTAVHNITVGGKGYKYFCMTLKNLVDGQYIKKDVTNYKGFIAMFVPDKTTEKRVIQINVSNGSFYFQGTYDVLSKDSSLPTQTAAPATDSAYKSFECYSTAPGEIPASKIANVS